MDVLISHSNKPAPSIIQKKNECRKMWATFVHAIGIKLNVNWFWFVGWKLWIKKPTRIDVKLNSGFMIKKRKKKIWISTRTKALDKWQKGKKEKKKLKLIFFSFISHDPKIYIRKNQNWI
jgi:CRISPR/Cas system CSM-associated protein Csm4 (group 5 of RAMP superfamily)